MAAPFGIPFTSGQHTLSRCFYGCHLFFKFLSTSDIAVADEQNPCHILKPLESIDISGLAGVLGHFLLLTLLAYPGIKWHSFDPESSRKGSKSRGLIPFYYPPLATRFSSACASSKPRWV